MNRCEYFQISQAFLRQQPASRAAWNTFKDFDEERGYLSCPYSPMSQPLVSPALYPSSFSEMRQCLICHHFTQERDYLELPELAGLWRIKQFQQPVRAVPIQP